MNLLMVSNGNTGEFSTRQIMVRLPEDDAAILEKEAASRSTTLAAYCRLILQEHIKNKNQTKDFKPLVREVVQELLKSDDLDEEFGKKVAKALSKMYE